MTVTCHVRFGNGRGRGDPPPDRDPLFFFFHRACTQRVQSLHKLFDDTLVSCSDSTSTPHLVFAIQPRPEPANVKGVAPSPPVLFSEGCVVQDHYA